MVMSDANAEDDLEYHPPTREEVLTQLEDWRKRLRALYADIISWLPPEEGYETEIRDVLADEGPMRQAGVSPQPVPELTVTRCGQPVLTFTPDACWIIGAAGRVKIRDGEFTHRLVDSDSPFVAKGWRLSRREWLRPALDRPLDRAKLRGLPFDNAQLRALLEPTDA